MQAELAEGTAPEQSELAEGIAPGRAELAELTAHMVRGRHQTAYDDSKDATTDLAVGTRYGVGGNSTTGPGPPGSNYLRGGLGPGPLWRNHLLDVGGNSTTGPGPPGSNHLLVGLSPGPPWSNRSLDVPGPGPPRCNHLLDVPGPGPPWRNHLRKVTGPGPPWYDYSLDANGRGSLWYDDNVTWRPVAAKDTSGGRLEESGWVWIFWSWNHCE